MKYMIRILSAEKRMRKDDYESGQAIDGEIVRSLEVSRIPIAIEDAFKLYVGGVILSTEIRTMDPNIYCDVKGGGIKTVRDNMSDGVYRAYFDRQEKRNGRKPSEAEVASWKDGNVVLYQSYYEITFNVLCNFDSER